MHAYNPAQDTSNPVYHCNCDPDFPSKRHTHITDSPTDLRATHIDELPALEKDDKPKAQITKTAKLPERRRAKANRAVSENVERPIISSAVKKSSTAPTQKHGVLGEASNRLQVSLS